MTYSYLCKTCDDRREVNKPSEKEKEEERCPTCNSVLEDRRLMFGGQQIIYNFQAGFYHAFGKTFLNQHELNNHIARENGEKGREIIAVGNELSYMRNNKPKSKPIDLGRAKYEWNRAIKKNAK